MVVAAKQMMISEGGWNYASFMNFMFFSADPPIVLLNIIFLFLAK